MRMRLGSTPWLFVLPLAFAGGALLARALLWHAPVSIGTDLAQPLPVATNWHDFGRTLWLLCFGCILVAIVPYFAVLGGILRRTERPHVATIVGIACLALAAALTMPVIFSSDVYAYAAYGVMDANGVSPYAHASLSIHDPLIQAAIWQWSNPLPV